MGAVGTVFVEAVWDVRRLLVGRAVVGTVLEADAVDSQSYSRPPSQAVAVALGEAKWLRFMMSHGVDGADASKGGIRAETEMEGACRESFEVAQAVWAKTEATRARRDN